MYWPTQTSLIPATVALARYIESHGFLGEYPYWYLGSTPIKYLIGPVVPSLLVFSHKIFPNLSFFDLSFLTLIFPFLFSALGWGILARYLSQNKFIGLIAGLITIILPWHWISSLGLSELSSVAASSLTPWVLLLFARYQKGPVSLLKANSKYQIFLPAASFALLLLTNTVSSIPSIVGMIILAIIFNKKWEEGLKRVGLVVFSGWLLTLWWYTPGYWLTILGAPSIGGKSAMSAFVTLLNLLRGFVPVILAVVLVWWKVKPKTMLAKFTLLWLVFFGSLTLFRFISDPDFWMDWTSWVGEVEVGVVLLASMLIFRSVRHLKKPFGQHTRGPVSRFPPASARFNFLSMIVQWSIRKLRAGGNPSTPATPRGVYPELVEGSYFLKWLPAFNFDRKFTIFYLLFTIYIVFGWVVAWQKRDFWLPRKDISQTVEYKIANRLDELVKPGETVFLSGTTAFWLNSFFDIRQVRGGVDQAAKDLRWRQAAWEIREGNNPQKSGVWLKNLNINYLVVHTSQSREFYHDFKYPEKFEETSSLQKVYDNQGDRIYRVR